MSPFDQMSDDKLLEIYRDRFRRGLSGTWTTSLGGGLDMVYGCLFEFRPDSTGRAHSWDSGDDEHPEADVDFRWTSLGDFTIDVQPIGPKKCEEDWGVIRFDFRARRNEYNLREIVLFQLD